MITIFGSVNADLIFKTSRMPSPGHGELCRQYDLLPGGKGANIAVAARRMGAEVRFFGAVGPDTFGDFCRENLEQQGVDCAGLWSVHTPTGCASITVDREGASMIVVAQGANLDAKADDVDLTNSKLVIMQMEVCASENWRLLARAKAQGIPTLLNLAPPAPISAIVLSQLDYLCLNEHEGTFLAQNLRLPDASRDFLKALHQLYPHLSVILTRGVDGAMAAYQGKIYTVEALPAIQPVDTTGAGDTFTGVFAASMTMGKNFLESLRYASVAGSLACEKKGAQASMPDCALIESRLAEIKPPIEI